MMNLKDSKIFIIKNTLKNKKNRFLMIVLSILLVLLVSILIFNHSLLNYMHDFKTKNISNRTLTAYNYYLEDLNVDEIKKIAHVTDVIPNFYNSIQIKDDEFPSFELQAIGDEELNRLELVSGSKNLEKGNIICPVNFVPIENANLRIDVSSKDIVNAYDWIGKKFNVTFNKTDAINEEVIILDTTQRDYQIIGTYQSEDYIMDNNICFTSVDTIKDIRDFLYIYNPGEEVDNYYDVIVDDVSNIQEVKDELQASNIVAKENIVLDYSLLAIIGVISVGLLTFAIAMIIITINLNLKRDLKNKEKEILIYRSIGYEKKAIKQIYLLQYLLIFLISSLISFSIIFILTIILKNYLMKLMMFRLIPLVFNYIEVIILVLVGILLPIMIVNSQINKILTTSKIK